MKWLRTRNMRRAQTALEYALMVAAFSIPMAYTVRELLSDSEEGAADNIVRSITKDSYGDETHFGVIGRPYP